MMKVIYLGSTFVIVKSNFILTVKERFGGSISRMDSEVAMGRHSATSPSTRGLVSSDDVSDDCSEA